MSDCGRYVIFSALPQQLEGYWLATYFPAMMAAAAWACPTPQAVEEALSAAGFRVIGLHTWDVPCDLMELQMNLELIKAIVILPGTALVYVPGAILWFLTESGMTPDMADPAQPRFWFALMLGAAGLALAVWTTSLFRVVGEGTPGPWAPPKRLVVRGPYCHVRNPMITSVLLMLGAESLILGSWYLAGWMLLFFLGNTIYFPLVEEPALERRFGDHYRHYKANVPRWIPRWRSWNAP